MSSKIFTANSRSIIIIIIEIFDTFPNSLNQWLLYNSFGFALAKFLLKPTPVSLGS